MIIKLKNKTAFITIKSGFTLVEVLLYMALVIIFFGVLTDLFVSTFDLKNESESVSAVEQDARFILSRLIYDANQSGSQYIASNYQLLDNNLVVNEEKLNSSGSKITEFLTTQLGNLGGKQTVQVKFKIQSQNEEENNYQIRDYQITLGSR